MTVKLTLTVDDAVVKRAKAYAKSTGRSLSELIESYLKLLISEDREAKGKGAPIVDSLTGVLSKLEDAEERAMLVQELEKKYSK